MADLILTDLTLLLNQHIETQETVSEQLFKARSLACAVSSQNFLEDYHLHFTQACLWLLIDVLTDTQESNDEALKQFKTTTRTWGLR